MLSYLRQRLVVAALTLLGVATVVFAMVHLLPGDPAETMLARSGAPPEAVAALRTELGLDDPLPVQYARWLSSLARGDLGTSLLNGRPVAELIREQFPYSLSLAIAGLAWALALGVVLGLIGVRWAYQWPDRLAMLLAVGGVTVPIFWSGLLLIWLFSVRLGWLPATGAGGISYLLMPSFVIGYASAGSIARLTRATLLEVMAQPYITAARAKGLTWQQALIRHAMRNALVPILTISGLQLGFLLGGTVITETLFSRPGMGRLLVDAILWQDLPLVQGVALVIAGLYVLTNLLVDLLAGWVNPQAGWQ